jgi:hypothetical protein
MISESTQTNSSQRNARQAVYRKRHLQVTPAQQFEAKLLDFAQAC